MWKQWEHNSRKEKTATEIKDSCSWGLPTPDCTLRPQERRAASRLTTEAQAVSISLWLSSPASWAPSADPFWELYVSSAFKVFLFVWSSPTRPHFHCQLSYSCPVVQEGLILLGTGPTSFKSLCKIPHAICKERWSFKQSKNSSRKHINYRISI